MVNHHSHHSHHHHQHHQQQPMHHQPRLRADYRIPAIEKYAYCLCLHVKPTTIFIAVFKLIRALLFASILLNTEFALNDHAVTSASAIGNDLGPWAASSATLDNGHKSTAAAVNILARIIMASVSAVGIYAVISGRAALLMPLYAILLVDFFFSLPAFYNRDSDPSFSDNIADLRQSYSPQANNQYTRYSIMLFSTLLMIIKIYFLCVIWKCYRYLRLIELVSPIIYPPYQGGGPCPIRIIGGRPDHDLTDAGGLGNNIAPPPYDSIASSMKPPNYEEAMKATNASPIYTPSTTATTVATIATPSLISQHHQQQQQQHQQQPVILTTSINPEQPPPAPHHQQTFLHHPEQQQQQLHFTISHHEPANDSLAIQIATDNLDARMQNNVATCTTTAGDTQVTITSTVQKPQDMTESTAVASPPEHSTTTTTTSDATLEKSPSIIIVDPRDNSRDKH